MFKKNLLALTILASMACLPLAQADEPAPVVEQQQNLLPPLEQPTAASSQSNDPTDTRWYVAPYGTYNNTGGDRHTHDGWGGGLAVGKKLNKNFNVEVKGFAETANGYNDARDPTRQNVGGSWDVSGATADVQYYPFRDKFSPYAVVGVGGMDNRVPGRSGASFIGEAGAGFTYDVHDNVSLRSDVRYRYNQNFNAHLQAGTEEFHDMTVNVGLVVPLGAKTKAPEPVAPAPVPTPVAVADCSTMDSDSDGVNDCLDKCPGTIAGSKVDANGCPISLELKGVNFEYDSAKLTQNAQFVLDGVAQSLINYPLKDDIEVHGHTSSEGSTLYNLKLSEKRSQSVAKYLASRGVSNRLIARGYGESQPVADNNTEQGRQQNRRVELIWTGH